LNIGFIFLKDSQKGVSECYLKLSAVLRMRSAKSYRAPLKVSFSVSVKPLLASSILLYIQEAD